MSRPRPAVPTVLHLDDQLLVVNKPTGVLVGPGNADVAGVPELLRGYEGLARDEPFEIVHRLDPEISGAIVYARSSETQHALRAMFAGGAVRQRFRALVQGYVQADGCIDLPIYFDKRRGRLCTSDRRGREARTEYRVVERVAGHTWIECEVALGRAEQIRVHLSAVGHPLAVDPANGNETPIMLSRFKPGFRPSQRHEERPLVDRLTMHAASLALDHPATGQRLEIEAPLHKDLRTTLRQLGRLA